MGLIDNLMNVMRLNPDDEDDGYMDEGYDDDEPEEEEKPARRGLFGRSKKEEEYIEPEPEPLPRRPVPEKTTVAAARPAAKITSISHPKKGSGAGMEVCVFKPTSVEDAREITETLLLGRTVLLNVEGLNLDVAQRIIDFVSGATFAIAGNLQKVSNFIFVLTPKGVDISGDYQDMMGFDISGSRKGL